MQSFFPAQNTCLLPAAPCAWKIPRPSPQTPAGGTEILKTFPPKHRKFPPPVSPRESPFRKKKDVPGSFCFTDILFSWQLLGKGGAFIQTKC